MNLKSKIVGTIAALGLSVSMIAGVAAAPSTVQVGGQVELKQGVCGLTLTASNSDFGDFTWIEGDYVRTSGNNEAYYTGTLYNARPGGTCNLTVSTTGLVGLSGVIPSTFFSWNYNGSAFQPVGSVALPGGGTINNVPASSGTVGLRLNDVPNTFQPDVYQGTLDITVTNGA